MFFWRIEEEAKKERKEGLGFQQLDWEDAIYGIVHGCKATHTTPFTHANINTSGVH